MKELEEAKEKIIETIREDTYKCLGLGEVKKPYREEYTPEGIAEAQELAAQILNLKGDGWRIAIISDEVVNWPHFNEKVIWQAGE